MSHQELQGQACELLETVDLCLNLAVSRSTLGRWQHRELLRLSQQWVLDNPTAPPPCGLEPRAMLRPARNAPKTNAGPSIRPSQGSLTTRALAVKIRVETTLEELFAELSGPTHCGTMDLSEIQTAFNRLVLSSNLRRPIPVAVSIQPQIPFRELDLMNRQHPSGLDLRRPDRTRFDRFLYLGTDIPAVSSDESGRA